MLQPADTMKATRLLLLLLSICPTSSHIRASVMVTPGRSQVFEYKSISVSCERFSSGEWTVWRYTTKGLKLSQCGSGFGVQNFSTCEMKTVKEHDSGVYWCESKHRDSSNAVNITVTGGSVILQSPVLPVMEGDDVTLHCEAKNPSILQAAFYKDGSLIGKEVTSHTIRSFSKSDEGAYKCAISGQEESPASWLLMKDDADRASLTVSGDSSQLFEYENLSLSCGDSRFHEWKIIRATIPGGNLSSCGDKWGIPNHFSCVLHTVKQHHSAIYWCESPARQRSNSVKITVYDSNTKVILQSPVLPVMEGDDVTLHCKTKTPPSNLPAAFYKDGSLVRTAPAGHMTIRHVSKSDEGLYKCNISSRGESPPSWLFVRDSNSTSPSTADPGLWSALRLIRLLVVVSPYCVSTILMVSLYRQRSTGRNLPVSMTMSPPSQDDEGLDQPYDDATADVTTEHHF